MSQFNLENAISDATRQDAPVQRGPMMRWQRKAMESGNRSSVSHESGLNCSVGRPKCRTPGLSMSPGRLGMNKTPNKMGKTPNKSGKTPNKSANNTPHRGPDRFIPNRSAMDIDLAHFALMNTENKSGTVGENGEPLSPSKVNYQHKMSEALNNGNDPHDAKILAFKQKAPEASAGHLNNLKVLYSANQSSSKSAGPAKTRQIPQQPERILDAPGLIDDYYLNLLSWSTTNMLAIGLGNAVYLWNASTGSITQLFEMDANLGPNEYTSALSWIKEGNILAVANSLGEVELWDAESAKLVRTMGGHAARVGSLSWNAYILSSGCRSGAIHHHDVRDPNHHVGTLTGHDQEVCGLAWSPDGRHLASGANDNLLNLWDNTISLSNVSPIHTMSHHQAAVKALAWCPWQSSVLASGGGTADRTIRLWNTNNGNCLRTVDADSQVCSLLWCPHYKELISGHGFAQFQLSIWKYPSMTRVTDLTGHTARVLALAMSADGTMVASAGADETLRLWRCFALDKSAAGKGGIGGRSEKKSSCIALTKGLR